MIEVFDDPNYQSAAGNNKFNYSKHYSSVTEIHLPTSKHGIKIYQDGKEWSSCIILGDGGDTEVHINSSVVSAGQLLVCCADNIFCLSLPSPTSIKFIQEFLTAVTPKPHKFTIEPIV